MCLASRWTYLLESPYGNARVSKPWTAPWGTFRPNLIASSIWTKYSGSMGITTHLNHISQCKII